MKEKIIKIEMYRPSITGFIVGFSVSNDTTSEKFYKKLFECIDKLGCDLSSDSTIITLTYPNDDKTTIINVRFTYYAEYDSNGISWSNSILKNIDNENELAVLYNNPSGECVYLTKNKFGFIERHKIKLLSEIFEILCDDDEVVKQSSGYNYIKPVNIADIGSSAELMDKDECENMCEEDSIDNDVETLKTLCNNINDKFLHSRVNKYTGGPRTVTYFNINDKNTTTSLGMESHPLRYDKVENMMLLNFGKGNQEEKQSSEYNYIKPVNIADIASSASETREENIKTDTTDNRFVYDELIWNPDVNIDVIRFISQYNDGDEFSKNSRDYDHKYSYHFAKLLKSIFNRGTVCYSTCYNKFVWCDDDCLSYGVKGNICMLRSGKLIPENKIPKTIIEFFKNPNCEDYYEKLHIFGYYMKSLLGE